MSGRYMGPIATSTKLRLYKAFRSMTKQIPPGRLKSANPRQQVKHSTYESLRSLHKDKSTLTIVEIRFGIADMAASMSKVEVRQ